MEEKQTKELGGKIRKITEIVMAVIILAFLVVYLVLCRKGRIGFTLDISADGEPATVQSITYNIDNYQNATVRREADYTVKDGVITIRNGEDLEGGTAFATYCYIIFFNAGGQAFEADIDFIRTNGNKKPVWNFDVALELTQQDGTWQVNAACDNCESVKVVSAENIPGSPIRIEIVERFGSLK